MYTIETTAKGRIILLYNNIKIGQLFILQEEATKLIRMLNTHPLADEEI